MDRLTLLLAALLAPFFAMAQTDQNPGDARVGRAMAVQTCSECHQIPGAQAPTARNNAPPFQLLANQPTTTAPGLRSLLRAPHAGMPMFRLTNAEMDDLVAYILSLRRG